SSDLPLNASHSTFKPVYQPASLPLLSLAVLLEMTQFTCGRADDLMLSASYSAARTLDCRFSIIGFLSSPESATDAGMTVSCQLMPSGNSGSIPSRRTSLILLALS